MASVSVSASASVSLWASSGACRVHRAKFRRGTEVVARAEGSHLRDGKRGLPLPITQPNGYMWNNAIPARKATPEEKSCVPTQDACKVCSRDPVM